MSTERPLPLLNALKAWAERYHAERSQLTVEEIHDIRAVLAQLTEQIERDATGPSTVPQPLPDDGS